MFLQFNPSDSYASIQQLQTQVTILRARLNLMRLDHPDRDALVTEFAALQAQLTVARNGVQRFGAHGFTF